MTVNAGTTNFLAADNTMSNDSASATFFAQANNTSTLNATVNDNSFSNANGRGLEIENNNVAAVRLSLLDNQASSGSVPAKPFLLDKNGGSFGVVLLNPQPDSEGFTAVERQPTQRRHRRLRRLPDELGHRTRPGHCRLHSPERGSRPDAVRSAWRGLGLPPHG